MSIQAVNWAMGVHVGSAIRKAVLIAVANYADQDGCCWPSQEKVAEVTELSVRSVRGALAELEAMGFLSRTERPRRPDMTRQSDLIQLDFRESEPRPEKASKPRSGRPYRQDVPHDLPAPHVETYRQDVPNLPAPRAGKPSRDPSIEPSLVSRASARPAKTQLPIDFGMTISRREVATRQGLSAARADREMTRFRNHYRGGGRLAADWDALWENWCLKAAELAGVPAPVAEVSGLLPVSVKVAADTDAGRAWSDYTLAKTGQPLKWFEASASGEPARTMPSLWPPGYEPREAAA